LKLPLNSAAVHLISKTPLIIILQLLQQLICFQWSQYWPNLHHFACSWPNNGLSFLQGHFLFFLFHHFIYIEFLFPTQTSTIVWASVSSAFLLPSYHSQLGKGLIRHILGTDNGFSFDHFLFPLSESSSECWRPEINCGLMSDRKCARNRYQT